MPKALLFFLFFSFAFASDYSGEKHGSLGDFYYLQGGLNQYGDQSFGESSLNSNDFLEIVEDSQDIDETLKKASQVDPVFFRYFTFMHKSKSLQQSSHQNPRAIVYGNDSRFTLTFNGHTQQEGYKNLELMQFIEDPYNSEFLLIDVHTQNSVNKITKNPSSCMRCHGTLQRPIFDAYEQWRGAYGEADDAIVDKNSDYHKKYPSSYADYELHSFNRDLEEYKKFKTAALKHPRYSLLLNENDPTFFPYNEKKRGDYDKRPNLRHTVNISSLHVRNVFNHIKQQGQCYEDLAPVMMADIMDCSNGNAEISQIMTQNKEKLIDFLKKRFGNLYTQEVWSKYESSPRLLILALQTLGYDRQSWNLKRDPEDWRFFAGGADLASYLLELIYENQKRKLSLPDRSIYQAPEADVDEYGVEVSTGLNKRDTFCRSISENLKVIRDISLEDCTTHKSPFLQKAQVGALTPKMCSSCHANGSNEAPVINFDDTNLLAKRPSLKNKILERILSKDTSQQMPPDRPLTIHEKLELMEYYKD